MNYSIYEINTRTWLASQGNKIKTVADIPKSYWRDLKSKGMDYVWLMGIWETTQSSIEKYCFHPDLMKEYDAATSSWRISDVGGSPYAVDSYQPSRLVGNLNALKQVRKSLNDAGLWLILDFVPNHFNADSQMIEKKPEVFLQVDKEHYDHDQHTYYEQMDRYFAHGRDPYFPAWTDTIQLNYFHPATHDFMLKTLLDVADCCDGVRCDMAMLILPEIFLKTWGFLQGKGASSTPLNFWQKAINTVKQKHSKFIFLAEAYWDTEWQLQQNGFDYTYDKTLLDRLNQDQAEKIVEHLGADIAFQKKMIRFIENHDEPRSISEMGDDKSRMASVAVATLPGMRFYYDGQWEGARIKQPVQLIKPANETKCPCTISRGITTVKGNYCQCQAVHYQTLLEVVQEDIFRSGTWSLLEVMESTALLSWIWQLDKAHRLVMINTSNDFQTGIIRLNLDPAEITISDDVLNDIDSPSYFQYNKDGLWQIRLPPFKSAILAFDSHVESDALSQG